MINLGEIVGMALGRPCDHFFPPPPFPPSFPLILTLPLQIFQPSPEPPTQLLILFGIIILISCLHWSCGHASVQITAPTKPNLFMSLLHTRTRTRTSAPKQNKTKKKTAQKMCENPPQI